MKVLLVLDVFSPLGGGVSSVVFKLANKLAFQGHDVTIYSTDDKRDEKFLAELDSRVKVVQFKTWLRFGGMNFAPGAILGSLKVKGFDVVHYHSYTSFINIPISFFAKLFSVPTIIDCHGNLPGTDAKGRKRFFHDMFGLGMFNQSSFLVAETGVGAEEYAALGGDRQKLIIQHPGFDVEDYSTLPSKGAFRAKLGFKENEKMIFFLGRLHEIKGLDFLVKAFTELAKKRDDVKLVLAGPDDGFKPQLDKIVSENNLEDKILFPGFMNHQQKMEALVDADIFVQPSRYEQGIAHTTIEALLCDLDVVATSGNGAAEDLERMKAAQLVPYGDNSSLIDAIEKALEGTDDVKALTKSGKDYIFENLALNKTVLKFEDLYKRA
ncbi:glycosyltransferase family 4 protein [Halobacteriovorax sp. GB3]|uniref:glycosyltransferase family 4 protein n=1 Tax=Halobacteriovorax sp. GB3 TaxID=2719615 RepID=UPI00235ED032|nr:glycosyltransferase family 4 protein [Halobacteriovorax sp. GB3]MDD0852509.1 glycosyltransferase family 4 protein [Halobacteriovorax sp. GB3]